MIKNAAPPNPTPDALPDISLTFHVTGRNGGKEEFHFAFPFLSLWHIYKVMNSPIGVQWPELHGVIETTGRMTVALGILGYPDPPFTLLEVWTQLELSLSERNPAPEVGPLTDEEVREYKADKDTPVVGFTYVLLRAHILSRTAAAGIASALLGRQDLISPDAWRVKVDRWAERNGYPPVGLHQRRAGGQQPNNRKPKTVRKRQG